MAFIKKTWLDRITEFPTRRTLTKSDQSTEVVEVARNEGDIMQEGDAFSASNMNDLETRIENEFNAVNQNLTKCAYWNSEDDYLYAYKDGVLTKGTLRLGLLHHYIFINDWQYQTAYGTPTLNGFSPLSNYITVEGGKIKTNLIATNGYYCSLRTDSIENNYNKIIIKGSFGTRTLDTSNFASVYLYLLNYTNQGKSVYYAFASSGLSSPITSCNGATQPLVLLENNTANVPMVYLIDEIYVE